MRSLRVWFLFVVMTTVLFTNSSFPYDHKERRESSTKLPNELDGIGLGDSTGIRIPPHLRFKDEQNRDITFGDLQKSKKPIVLSPVYFKCPSLCNYHLNGVLKVFKKLDWNVGSEFEYVAFSFDPKETPELAAQKKETYLQEYNRKGTDAGWHFLTSDEKTIREITTLLKFKYRFDEESKQYVHASTVYIISPEGIVARILPGIDWDSRDLKLALLEATQGKIGGFKDKFTLFCFQFDPKKSKYTLYAFRIMQFGTGITCLSLAGFLLYFWKFKNKSNYRSSDL